jgi:hypothetical protein
VGGSENGREVDGRRWKDECIYLKGREGERRVGKGGERKERPEEAKKVSKGRQG